MSGAGAVGTTRRAVRDARRALWHLRTGGFSQARTFVRRRSIERRPSLEGRVGPDGSLTFPPWDLPDRPPNRPGLRVAVVLDDFSRLAFRYEWDQLEVQPSTWRAMLEAGDVDLLFVESAWAGNGGGWRYHLTGPSAPRPALVELVEWCRQNGVPTVFWNKEDPAHLEDFLPTAALFDHVFTTDSTCLATYRRALGHDLVGVLPFAAQPAVHNPVRPAAGHQARDVAFAGMYFAHRHPERRRQMDLLLGAALRAGARMPTGLEIFSRQLGGDDRYQFPPPFDARVVGSLTYGQVLSAYKAYKLFLNVNTVVDSPSMCARRVFEILACGTPVVSTRSAALGRYFDAFQVPQVDDGAEAEHVIRALARSPELRDRMVHLAQRAIWSGHTYGHRVEEVLAAVGSPARRHATRPEVSALVASNRPHQLDHVLRTLGSQEGVDLEVVVLAHGWDLAEGELSSRAREHGLDRVVALTARPDVSLGECLNRLVQAASGGIVAKIDDDDLYGPHYLGDQVHALGYSGAQVVGKQAHYLLLEGLDATLLRFREREHRDTDFVMGPTIVARRDLAAEVGFPQVARGEDTGFLRAAAQSGARIYSADRFNFIQVRRPATGGHTWQMSEAELLASGDVVAFGSCSDHVMV